MKKYRQFLTETQSEPPYGLSESIVERIHVADRSALRIRSFAYIATTLLSSVAFVVTALRLWANLGQSGFYQYLSLFLSDGATLGLYWKQLGLSLIESLPLLNLALLLSILGAFLWSGTNAIRNTQAALLPA